MREVFLVGVGATSFVPSPRPGGVLADEAAGAALEGCGLRPKDVAGASLRGRNAPDGELAALFAGRTANGRDRPWAGRSLQRAWQAVAAGSSDLVLCVGADDGGAAGVVLRERADAARRYMVRTGATAEHLGRITVKNRAFGAANPRVEDQAGVRLRDVLGSEVVAWPLRQLMVARPASGAAAVVLASREGLRRTSSYEVRVRASVLLAGPGSEARGDPRWALGLSGRRHGPRGRGPRRARRPHRGRRARRVRGGAVRPLRPGPRARRQRLHDRRRRGAGEHQRRAALPGRDACAAPLAQLCELTWQLRGERRGATGARRAERAWRSRVRRPPRRGRPSHRS